MIGIVLMLFDRVDRYIQRLRDLFMTFPVKTHLVNFFTRRG